MSELTLGHKFRVLTAENLGIGFTATALRTDELRAASAPDSPKISEDDVNISRIAELLERYAGVLLSGPPGTSKSYWARAAAEVLTDGDHTRQVMTQFHPSYQYEDFMEGYRPSAHGGFTRRLGVFLELCEEAAKTVNAGKRYVIVIDELSRGDAARIFGESLTYVERSKRGLEFGLPSGEKASIPPNVSIIATMNPLDRSVDEIDAAFERRFAKVAMGPDSGVLDDRLRENGVEDGLRVALLQWFVDINAQVDVAHMGHAYFWDVTDPDSLNDIWEHQVQHHVNRAFRFDEQNRERLIAAFDSVRQDAGWQYDASLGRARPNSAQGSLEAND